MRGQLGSGNNTNANTPQAVAGIANPAKQLAAGGWHTCALLANGSLQCWGLGQHGQLGTGSSNGANTPQDTLPVVTHIAGNLVQNGGGIRLSGRAGNWRVQQNSLIANAGNGIDFSCNSCSIEVNNNSLAANGGSGLKLAGSEMRAVGNTVVRNQGDGLMLGGSGIATAYVQHNNLVDNEPYDLYLESGSPGSQNFTLDAANNFWNVPEAAIPARIRDCTFDENGCNGLLHGDSDRRGG